MCEGEDKAAERDRCWLDAVTNTPDSVKLKDCRIPGPAITTDGLRKAVLALSDSAGPLFALLMEFNPLLPGQAQPVLGDPWVTVQPLTGRRWPSPATAATSCSS